MPHPRFPLVAGVVASLLAGACGGGDDGPTAGGQAAASTTASGSSAVLAATSTSTTRPAIEGVQTFLVDAGHRDGPLTYPHTPPVGGIHHPAWQPCTFYEQPVSNELAVHSLEHGAIWITYRPDVPQSEVDVLARLARSRNDVLVSPWEQGLPAPIVATAWGRQLQLQSAGDPRLMQFVTLYANQGPEINARC